MPTRKSRPVYITRDEAEAMIAAAVAAEQDRNDKAMAAVMLALGGFAQVIDNMGDALGQAGRTLDLHADVIAPMADAFAAGLAMQSAAAGMNAKQ